MIKHTDFRKITSAAPEDAGRHFKPSIGSVVAMGLLLLMIAAPVSAQITGGVTGIVLDSQGAVIPGATVTVTSETKGVKVGTTVTNEMGVFQLPNLAPDKYEIMVEMQAFKTLKRSGIEISPGPVTTVGNLTIEVGNISETVIVTGEATLVQSVSGEKSFTVTPQQMESLPVQGRDFGALLQLTPGVNVGTGLAAAGGVSGAGGSSFMVDGVINMDPGINRQATRISMDAISEVRALTSSYQAEYGRAAGLQVNVVTKSGSNQFHGGFYYVARDSRWYSNSKTNILNGDPKATVQEKDYGGSIGGPIGKSGGNNRLFFFTNLEFNPRSRAGSVVNYRMPTRLERQGDFSQTLDNNGNLYPYIKDPLISGTCSASNQTACFKDGGVLGKIPQDRLYQTGLNILKWWPEPNLPTVAGVRYNYERTTDKVSMLGYAPVVKIDYQATENLRLSVRVAQYLQPTRDNPQNIPGFTDVTVDNIGVYSQMYTTNWTLNPTTYIEGSFGRNNHHQAGCSVPGGSPTFCGSQGGLSTSPKSNRKNVGMEDIPYLYPDAFTIDKNYWAYQVMNDVKPAYWDGTRAWIVPSFSWGNRITNTPPNISWPSFIQTQTTNTFNGTATKITGGHTLKLGLMYAASVQQDGRSSMQGTYNFANDSNNPLDSQFGFANAALGVFSSITQTKRWTEGANNSRNIEWFVQDNWKVTRKVTLDYGLRFVNQRAVFDTRGQGSNFLPDTYKTAQAPLLYQYGCANGVYPCSGSNRVAFDPVTGQQVPGTTSAQAAALVGNLVPNTGTLMNGLHVPGTDIVKTYWKFPKIVLAPRWGVAWDLTGKQNFVIRGGGGIFYDRTQTQESYTVVNNPPTSGTSSAYYGFLQNLSGAGLKINAPSSLRTFEYEPGVPTSLQWNGGVQMKLPFSAALDVSYTGQHAWNKWTSGQDINSFDIGQAFDPAFQDPTLTPVTQATPANSLVNTNPNQARFFKGFAGISQITFNQWQTYHSIQISLTRRLRNGLAFGFVDTIGLYDHGKINDRFAHNYATRTIGIRADQAQAQELLGNNNPAAHSMKANFSYQLPKLKSSTTLGKAIGLIVNDWQLSGIWTGITSTPYTVGFSYSSGGSNLNLTGSPNYGSRIILTGDPGNGCSSSDLLRQFNTSAFKGPAVGSVGLESGNNYLKGCFQTSMDLAINRTIRLRESMNIQLRVDVFNAFNQAGITGRSTSMSLSSPSSSTTINNLPFDSAGNVIASRATPRGGGFGIATGFQTPRQMQITARFNF